MAGVVANVALIAFVLFVFLFLFIAQLVVAPALQEELDDKSGQRDNGAGPVQCYALVLRPSHRVELVQLVAQRQTAVKEKNCPNKACEGHSPEAEEEQGEQSAHQKAKQRLVPQRRPYI